MKNDLILKSTCLVARATNNFHALISFFFLNCSNLKAGKLQIISVADIKKHPFSLYPHVLFKKLKEIYRRNTRSKKKFEIS